MTIQPHTVTPDALDAATTVIINARDDVAHYEVRQAQLAHYYNSAEADLAVAHRALMARSDAGSNDNARRASADRETVAERDRLARIADELLDVEAALIRAKAILAQATDRRRLLETLVSLAATGPHAPAPAYYTGPDGDPFARAEVEVEVAA